MNESLSSLQTPKECWQFAKMHPDLASEAYRRAIELRLLKYVDLHGEINKVEKELLKAIYAYEDELSESNIKEYLQEEPGGWSNATGSSKRQKSLLLAKIGNQVGLYWSKWVCRI